MHVDTSLERAMGICPYTLDFVKGNQIIVTLIIVNLISKHLWLRVRQVKDSRTSAMDEWTSSDTVVNKSPGINLALMGIDRAGFIPATRPKTLLLWQTQRTFLSHCTLPKQTQDYPPQCLSIQMLHKSTAMPNPLFAIGTDKLCCFIFNFFYCSNWEYFF